jgi:hypothetical protein
MSFAPGRTAKYSAKRFCPKCKTTTDHLCSRVSSRESEKPEDLNIVTRVWSCLVCGYGYDQVVEIPMPTEGGMILKRLMTVTNDYYVKRTSVTSKGLHVILDVELYPFEPEPVIRIIEKLEENQYINALELDRLRKAGLRRMYDREKFLKRPLWPKTREEIRARLYKIRPHLDVKNQK